MFLIGKELIAEPVDILVLLFLFHEMDTNPHQSYVSRQALVSLIEGKSLLTPDQILENFHSLDSEFLFEEKMESGTQESPEIESYYTLTIEGLRWLFSNTHEAIETANRANWEFPDYLIAKLWSRRIETDNIENERIPGSDRFLSVKDNQEKFDEISDALTTIKNEFAKDHFKLANSFNSSAVVAEIEAFELQIQSDWVSRPAAQNFIETLKYIRSICVEVSIIATAAGTAIAALVKLLGLM